MSADADAPSVLLVDDDEPFRTRLAAALRERGLSVRTEGDGEAALLAARADPPELAVVDLRMPGITGLDVLRGLLAIDPHTRIVVLTGYGSVPTAVDAIQAGAVHYLQKPVTVAALLSALGLEDVVEPSGGVAIPDVSLARAEWEHIHRVLADCEGNVSEAARRLRIHRRSLQRKLQKLPPKS